MCSVLSEYPHRICSVVERELRRKSCKGIIPERAKEWLCNLCSNLNSVSMQLFFCFTVYVHQTSCSMTRTWYQRKLTSVCWETMGYYLANYAFYSIRQAGSRLQLKEPSPAPSELSPLHCWYTAGLAGCPCGVMQVDGLPRLRLTPTDFRTAIRAAALSVFRV